MVQIQGVQIFDLSNISISNDYLVSDIFRMWVKHHRWGKTPPGWHK